MREVLIGFEIFLGPEFDEAGATKVAGLHLIGDLVVGKKHTFCYDALALR